MVKEELIQRSPIRLLENMLGSELQAGEVGVISSPSGLGKTSVLVQIALHQLLLGKKVIHVSFTQATSYVHGWYENIYGELTKNKNLELSREILEEASRGRVVLNFNQDGVTSDTIRASLRAMVIDGGFKASSIIIDGFDFTKVALERVLKLKEFAKEAGLSLWYSCTVKEPPAGYDARKIPLVLAPIKDEVEVVFVLEPKPDYIALSVSKNRDKSIKDNIALKLDPKTLLILE
jgi:hypothetical protein